MQKVSKDLKVSVIICRYNCPYTVDAIQSCFDQDYENLEICIVDDHSGHIDDLEQFFGQKFADDTVYEIQMERKCKFIRLSKNCGPSVARNVGIQNTDGEYVAILDSDDLLLDNKISECAKILGMYDHVGSVYGDYEIVNVDRGTSVTERKMPYSRSELLKSCIVHSGSVIKRSVLEDVKDEFGYYDVRIKGPEDYDLWLRISEKYMIYHVPKILTRVRQTGNNISSNTHPEFTVNYQNGFSILNQKLQERERAKIN